MPKSTQRRAVTAMWGWCLGVTLYYIFPTVPPAVLLDACLCISFIMFVVLIVWTLLLIIDGWF